jgi:hypothetical protein
MVGLSKKEWAVVDSRTEISEGGARRREKPKAVAIALSQD